MAARKTTILIIGLITGLLHCIVFSAVSKGIQYELITNINLSRSGTVAPYCGMGCWYTSGNRLNLVATPYNGYVFDVWSGDCAGDSPSVTVSMTASKSCTANFVACADQPVKRVGSGFSAISSAYGGAADGDIISILATNLYGDLLFDQPVSVTLEGGYNCGYGANASMSLIQGSVVIAKGTVTMENLMIISLPAAPPIPELPPESVFDYVRIVQGTSGNQTELGTEGKDLIAEYGGTGPVSQFITGSGADDWLLQVGSMGTTAQNILCGTGNDTIYQYGVGGETTQDADGGLGGDIIFQVGGPGSNTMSAAGNDDIDYIEQYGGPGPNIISTNGGAGDDDILMVGGPSDDTFNYDLSTGNDISRIYGNGGHDSLTINAGSLSFMLYDAESGEVLYSAGSGGTTITLFAVEHVHVLGPEGTVVYTHTVPPAPPSVPSLPPSSGFDYVKIIQGTSGDQLELGSEGKDLIAEYGGTGTVNQYMSGADNNDWLLQVGSSDTTSQRIRGGTGNDTMYQYCGGGETIQSIEGGLGADIIIQVGGSGTNTVSATGSEDNDHIEQYGGPDPNTMDGDGGAGDDDIVMVGGPSDDVFTYTVSAGNDVARIYGKGGHDNLTINAGDKSFTLYEGDSGGVLFAVGTGGSTITVFGVGYITVKGSDGSIIYEH